MVLPRCFRSGPWHMGSMSAFARTQEPEPAGKLCHFQALVFSTCLSSTYYLLNVSHS